MMNILLRFFSLAFSLCLLTPDSLAGIKFTPGVHFGPSFANGRMKNPVNNLNTNTSTNLGIMLGASGEMDFNHVFLFFQPEFNYVEKGTEYTSIFNGATTTFKYNYSYLNFPLLAKAKFEAGNSGFKTFAVLGPEFSFLVKASYEESQPAFLKRLDIYNQSSQLELGFVAGIGAEVEVTPSINTTAQIRYSHGFSNINEQAAPFNYEWRNYTWQFLLGAGFEL